MVEFPWGGGGYTIRQICGTAKVSHWWRSFILWYYVFWGNTDFEEEIPNDTGISGGEEVFCHDRWRGRVLSRSLARKCSVTIVGEEVFCHDRW